MSAACPLSSSTSVERGAHLRKSRKRDRCRERRARRRKVWSAQEEGAECECGVCRRSGVITDLPATLYMYLARLHQYRCCTSLLIEPHKRYSNALLAPNSYACGTSVAPQLDGCNAATITSQHPCGSNAVQFQGQYDVNIRQVRSFIYLYCVGAALVKLWCDTGTGLALYWYCTITMQAPYCHYTHIGVALVLCWHCAGLALGLDRYCTGSTGCGILVCWCYADTPPV